MKKFGKIRYLVFDIDGTLIHRNQTITPRTKKAILRAKEKGIHLAIASGRNIRGFDRFARELNFGPGDFLIGLNGGQAETIDGRILYRDKGLALDQIRPYVDFWQQDEVLFYFYYYDRIALLARSLEEEVEENLRVIESLPFARMASFDELTGRPIKVLLRAEEALINRGLTQLDPSIFQSYHLVRSEPYFLEMMNADIDKGASIREICQFSGCQPEEIIAFGDQKNDLGMIRQAGTGIAMGNATPELKEAADLVIGHHNEDGIGRFLESSGLLD